MLGGGVGGMRVGVGVLGGGVGGMRVGVLGGGVGGMRVGGQARAVQVRACMEGKGGGAAC